MEGNLHRALWKSCCWDYCSTANISTEERALYGSLSGNLKGKSSVKNKDVGKCDGGGNLKGKSSVKNKDIGKRDGSGNLKGKYLVKD